MHSPRTHDTPPSPNRRRRPGDRSSSKTIIVQSSSSQASIPQWLPFIGMSVCAAAFMIIVNSITGCVCVCLCVCVFVSLCVCVCVYACVHVRACVFARACVRALSPSCTCLHLHHPPPPPSGICPNGSSSPSCPPAVPPHHTFFVILLAIILTFGLGGLLGATNQSMALPSSMLIQMAWGGLLLPGNIIANVVVAAINNAAVAQSLSLLSDYRTGILLKIAPRVMFVTQLLGTAVGVLVGL